jgi:hypothetical protein
MERQVQLFLTSTATCRVGRRLIKNPDDNPATSHFAEIDQAITELPLLSGDISNASAASATGIAALTSCESTRQRTWAG